jgi:hypothetical protein
MHRHHQRQIALHTVNPLGRTLLPTPTNQGTMTTFTSIIVGLVAGTTIYSALDNPWYWLVTALWLFIGGITIHLLEATK